MDIGPYNLPETSTVNVEISPLLRGFIWKFRRIIAQAGILWLKTFYVIAERHTGGSGSLHSRSLRSVLQFPRAAPAEYWPPRKAHSTYEVRAFGARAGAVSPARKALTIVSLQDGHGAAGLQDLKRPRTFVLSAVSRQTPQASVSIIQ